MSEHLVWGRLPPGLKLSVGSTVVIEPSKSRCVHRNVLVGRVNLAFVGRRLAPGENDKPDKF